ncbi:MAG: PglZ domain-containing protein [Cytophagaceae bacterium]|nr:PglZ domain-containing protein [Cytophagaceae bacterium]MDW8456550.1 bifunctional response regulator/alkaline phosphatase family protein [Cytophagaceae bacterium]
MNRYSILWADDEIELLKPHILFLTSKGYNITPVNSGADALDKITKEKFDVVFMDEHMPGMSGLETLSKIKNIRPNLPVVMITKSEEEHIMEEAIGSKIADYLIKPINPNQILLSLKKILDNKKLIEDKTNTAYRQEFMNISASFADALSHQDWAELYKKLVYWELEIEDTQNKSMVEILSLQKAEANANFSKFIMREYESWLNTPNTDRPVMSHQLMKKKVFPLVEQEKVCFLILIDNLRYDQWKILEPILSEYFYVNEESTYYSILPTTTAYARNAIFAGLMPDEIITKYPQWWIDEEQEESKNNYENELLNELWKRHKIEGKISYHKIRNQENGKNLASSIHNLYNNKLNVIVYNFVDMLSHARTDMAMIRELAPDESAYRSLTRSWFLHSTLFDILKKISENPNAKLIITTDHGTIRVKNPLKIIGDKSVNTNLRYKSGKNLTYDTKNVYVCKKPERLRLPQKNISTSYVFCIEDNFFAYPNNFNYYVNYFKDTFQHGGISLEEIIVPYVVMSSKQRLN